MNENEIEAKARILSATIAILNEGADPERVTVRQIAERAGVAIGAVNYHFQSKDRLLNDAVGALMAEEVVRWSAPDTEEIKDPAERLRALLRQTSLIGARYPRLLGSAVRYDLLQGRFAAAETVMPLLREIAAGSLTERQLRLLALQLMFTLQAMFLRRDEVQHFAGVNLSDEEGLLSIIDFVLANTLAAIRGCKEKKGD